MMDDGRWTMDDRDQGSGIRDQGPGTLIYGLWSMVHRERVRVRMEERISPLAGKLPPPELLIDVAQLLGQYYDLHPDPAAPEQRVAFGTSGHRGSAADRTFNEDHILAVTQAIAEYRQGQGISGPLYLGK